MKVYLDNCVFNRPFDEQSRLQVRMETEAKLHIQESIKRGKLVLAWSYILDFENGQNPFLDRKQAIAKWRSLATIDVGETPALLLQANQFVKLGVKAKDALHAACAIEAGADYFLSTDIKLVKKLMQVNKISAMNPINFIEVLDR